MESNEALWRRVHPLSPADGKLPDPMVQAARFITRGPDVVALQVKAAAGPRS